MLRKRSFALEFEFPTGTVQVTCASSSKESRYVCSHVLTESNVVSYLSETVSADGQNPNLTASILALSAQCLAEVFAGLMEMIVSPESSKALSHASRN